MSLTLSAFIEQAIANPVLIIILLLVLGVTAISGVTDAPNAIANAPIRVRRLKSRLRVRRFVEGMARIN